MEQAIRRACETALFHELELFCLLRSRAAYGHARRVLRLLFELTRRLSKLFGPA